MARKKDPFDVPVPELLAMANRALIYLSTFPEARRDMTGRGFDVAGMETTLQTAVAHVGDLLLRQGDADGDLREARADALEAAGRAAAWSKDLRARLPAARRRGGAAEEARRRVLGRLRSRAVRFRGLLDDLRRVVPELRATRTAFDGVLGLPDPIVTGEAMLADLEAHATALDEATRNARAATADLAAGRRSLERDLRDLRFAWDLSRPEKAAYPPSAAWVKADGG